MSEKDNLTDLLNMAMRNRLAELQTATPAIVRSYDYKTQKASVQPAINRRYKDGQIAEFPIIVNVPVIFPRSGGASLTFPVNVGDTVLLVFASRSIDDWAQRGGVVNQSDTRMHDLNDAIAIPGLIPFVKGSAAKNNTDVLLTYAGSSLTIKKDGQVDIESGLKVNVKAPDVVVDADLTHFKGNITTEGSIVAATGISDFNGTYGSIGNFRDIYNSHTHNENDNSPAPTNAPNQLWEDV